MSFLFDEPLKVATDEQDDHKIVDFQAMIQSSSTYDVENLLTNTATSDLLNYSFTAAAAAASEQSSDLDASSDTNFWRPLSSNITNDSTTLGLTDAVVDCGEMPAFCGCHPNYDSYGDAEIRVMGFIALPVILFGLFANIISIRIFTHRVMISSSINWYLAILSCSDTLILFSALCVLTLPRVGERFHAWFLVGIW